MPAVVYTKRSLDTIFLRKITRDERLKFSLSNVRVINLLDIDVVVVL